MLLQFSSALYIYTTYKNVTFKLSNNQCYSISLMFSPNSAQAIKLFSQISRRILISHRGRQVITHPFKIPNLWASPPLSPRRWSLPPHKTQCRGIRAPSTATSRSQLSPPRLLPHHPKIGNGRDQPSRYATSVTSMATASPTTARRIALWIACPCIATASGRDGVKAFPGRTVKANRLFANTIMSRPLITASLFCTYLWTTIGLELS